MSRVSYYPRWITALALLLIYFLSILTSPGQQGFIMTTVFVSSKSYSPYFTGNSFVGHHIRDLNGEYHSGFAIAQTTSHNGSRLSTAKAFLRPFKHRRNLNILLNSTVARVLINTTTKQAYGVEVLNHGKKQVIYASKEVIISGGK